MRPIEVYQILRIALDEVRSRHQAIKPSNGLARYDAQRASAPLDHSGNACFEHAVEHPVHIRPQARRRQLASWHLSNSCLHTYVSSCHATYV